MIRVLILNFFLFHYVCTMFINFIYFFKQLILYIPFEVDFTFKILLLCARIFHESKNKCKNQNKE